MSFEIKTKESKFNEQLKTLMTENKTQSEKIQKLKQDLTEGNLKNFFKLTKFAKIFAFKPPKNPEI